MKIKTIITNFSENYFFGKEKNLRRAKISSVLIFLGVLFLFALNAYDFWQVYGLKPLENSQISSNIFKAVTYQLFIIMGLAIRLISLRFNGLFALKFSEFGTFLAFSAWLGYLVWTTWVHNEIAKIADVNWSSPLHSLANGAAILISFGFIVWFFYKIIFLIAVIRKAVRK